MVPGIWLEDLHSSQKSALAQPVPGGELWRQEALGAESPSLGARAEAQEGWSHRLVHLDELFPASSSPSSQRPGSK